MLAATIFSLVAGLARIQAFAFQHSTQVRVRTVEAVGEDEEEIERTEEEILGSFVATTIADLEIEKEYMSKLLTLARKVQEFGHESKFERLRGIIKYKRFFNEKLLVLTEHCDTFTYLKSRLDGLEFTGQVASIHGGMNYLERGDQVAFFKKPIEEGGVCIMACTDAAGEDTAT